MLIPPYNCGNQHRILMRNDSDFRVSLKLRICKEGTYCILWSNKFNRPIKNGKLFIIDKNGKLRLFKNVNKLFCHLGPENTIKIK